MAARPTPLILSGMALFLCILSSHGAPVLRWDFSAEEASQLRSHGGVHRDIPGPRPPDFPDFEATNTAVQLDGKGAHFSFADSGEGSVVDFTNGDAITLEAWVNVSEISTGESVAVIGKGRTGNHSFARDNQNWALRLREQKGISCINFLFATPLSESQPTRDSHWHRWTTSEGFTVNTGWHHIAISYRFGDPKSITGWLDGRTLTGKWDMGGETTEPPVVDNDEVWIGSSNGASAANSFRGMIDAVAIHREIVPADILKTRFNRKGGTIVSKPATEEMPALGPLPTGKVRVSAHQGAASPTRWLNEGEQWPKETSAWSLPHFFLSRLPLRYDDWGIRDVWQGPVLIRMAGDVVLPAGRQKFLIRARALSRLWVNGAAVARTESKQPTPRDGEEELTPVAKPLLPGLRPPSYEQLEAFGEADVPLDGKCRVVFEMLVGSSKMRADTGEVCVAIQGETGRAFSILSSEGNTRPLLLTNAALEPELKRHAAEMENLDLQTRKAAASAQDIYWRDRHEKARQWMASHPAPKIPAGEANPVDAFLVDKIRRALEAASKTPPEESKHFHTKVLGVLREECFRCHGDKEKGGLRLNSREAALKGGESGRPAVIPGSVEISSLIERIRSKDEDERMPPKGGGLKPEQIAILEEWVKTGAPWPSPPVAAADVAPSAPLSDTAFLRRLTLDLTGQPPTEKELVFFLADQSQNKRERAIDRLLEDPRWADSWMPYWMDVLAENPTLINPTLNTTGPFRWFLLEALRDNKPADRFVTELLMLRGSSHTGGSAGFGLAGESDSPFASKGQILASAFLGIELQCARCHDSPYHSTKQADLYALAAMIDRKPATVPKSSSVPAAFFEKKTRESLIKVTLKPGVPVPPKWPFEAVTGVSGEGVLQGQMQNSDDSRERLAFLVTSPQNTRFAQVLVNRVWRRYMGAGFVEPVSDWEGHPASHPELLEWLARDFVAHDYDFKHLTRRIVTSRAYQSEATGSNLATSAELRFFNAPERRRLTAEQIVDALHTATGQVMDTEEITFDPTGRRPEGARITLGKPTRAWMLANLTNDRDRPSLSLPYAQRVVDVLEAFGWSGARQAARTDRETAPSVLQPGVLANGALSLTLTRASVNSSLASLAVEASVPETLVESLFLRFLSRFPNAAESAKFSNFLKEGFDTRIVTNHQIQPLEDADPLPLVTWFNHLNPEATTIALESDRRARRGPPPDVRLRSEWRERYEDVVWSLVNHSEFVWIP